MTSDSLRVDSLFSMAGKTALVTGGSRGIGFMIARGLVENGVRVYVTSRKAGDCDRAADELGRLGACTSLPADVSSVREVERLAEAVREREPALHVLVNNAGATWGAPLEEFPEAGFDKVVDVNLKAPFFVTTALLPLLRAGATADDPARVVMIGSVDGLRVPFTENYPYAATKAGVHMLARQLAHRLAADHITVNSIAPGAFESKMTAHLLEDEDGRDAMEARVPLRRLGSPSDAAGATIFLCSRAGSYLTGATVPLDGGISTHG